MVVVVYFLVFLLLLQGLWRLGGSRGPFIHSVWKREAVESLEWDV